MHHMNSSPSLLTADDTAPVAPPRRNSSAVKNSKSTSLSNLNNDESFIANKDESKNNRPMPKPTASLQLQAFPNNSNSTSNNSNYSNNSISNDAINNNSGNIDNNSNRPHKVSNYYLKEEQQIQRNNTSVNNGPTENIYGAEERLVRKLSY